MTSLTAEQSTHEEALAAIAETLLGVPVSTVTRVKGSGNNRVYRIENSQGRFALKSYPPAANDQRNRLRAEFEGLDFLARHGVTVTPRAIAYAEQHGVGIYEWIDGDPNRTPSEKDIEIASSFIETLRQVSTEDDAQALPLASEACLSAADIVTQISQRLERLQEISDSDALRDFLADGFLPVYHSLVARAQRLYSERAMAFDAAVAPSARHLSPSDFGFHNTLRRADGRIVFVDFEYFGWDDPVKLLADFILHPGHVLSDALKQTFCTLTICQYVDDSDFQTRLDALFPLFGMRWCMILLNEFLPERLARRIAAGHPADAERARQAQLSKAQNMLNDFRQTEDGFPYGH